MVTKGSLLVMTYMFFSLVHCKVISDRLGEKLKNIDVMCTRTHAIITYVGDPKAVIAFGQGRQCIFDAVTTEAKYTLIATFEKRSPDDCVMQKHPNMNIYHIEVEARFTAPDMEADGDETAVLSCNFEIMLSSQAETIHLKDPIVMPIIVEDEHAPRAESKMLMEVHLVNGKVLPAESVVGTEVELTAAMEPAPGEVAFQALLCYADMNEAKLSVPIIVDGCGTGHPFPEDRGFIRYNLFAKGPSFGLFRAAKAQEVQFRCEFLICPDNCDMYSCPAEREKTMRHRRSADPEVEIPTYLEVDRSTYSELERTTDPQGRTADSQGERTADPEVKGTTLEEVHRSAYSEEERSTYPDVPKSTYEDVEISSDPPVQSSTDAQEQRSTVLQVQSSSDPRVQISTDPQVQISADMDVEISSKRLWAKTQPRKVFLRGEARKKQLDYNDLVVDEGSNLTDPRWNRLVNEQIKLGTPADSTAVFPMNLLALIIVGGILVVCVVTGVIWAGWRYATRSVNITVTPRRVIREISAPQPYLPPNSIDPTGSFYDLAL